MQRVDDEFLLRILRACSEHSPLYPAAYAKEAGVDRALLDQALDMLRTNGLLALSPWVKGQGQGCELTDAGKQAIAQPSRLHQRPEPETPSRAGKDTALEEVIRFFERPLFPYITWTMLALNVLAFVAGMLYAPSQDVSIQEYVSETSSTAYSQLLRKEGALYSLDVFPPRGSGERPEIERMLICNFLHIGLIHLLVNMWSLVNLGRQIEAMWGYFRYLVLYLVSGLCSAGFVLWQGRFVQTAGASGVLFGLFAGMVVWFLMHRRHLNERVTQAWSRNIGLNLVLLVAVNFMPDVSWEGHLGGAIGGVLAALCLSQVRFRKSPIVSALALLATLSLPVILYVLAYRANY